MQKESCQPSDHQWLCIQTSGSVGEITTGFELTPEQIQQVKSDNSMAETVCPNGAILCKKCDEPLINDQSPKNVLPNIEEINRRLF